MMKKKKSRVEILSILAAIPMFLFLGLAVATAQESVKTSQKKQADILSAPSQVDQMKVKKGESAGKTETDQKYPVGTGVMIPPPPPPPPMQKEKKAERSAETEMKKDLEKRNLPPPPPPPPPGDGD